MRRATSCSATSRPRRPEPGRHASGPTRRLADTPDGASAAAPKVRFRCARVCCPQSDIKARSKSAHQKQSVSFNHLVGSGNYFLRNPEAERLRGLEVDDKLELRGRLNRKVARLRAP